MATTDELTGKATARFEWSRTASLVTGAETDATSRLFELALTAGTGSNQIDRHFHDQFTLAPSASTTIDLTALSQLGYHGSAYTVNFARVKVIAVVNLATIIGTDLHIDTSVTNAWIVPWDSSTTTLHKVKANSGILMVDPLAAAWPVTAGTADIMKFTNTSSTDTLTFRLALLGVSV